MAFSFRKMLSNINYFKKSEDGPEQKQTQSVTSYTQKTKEENKNIDFEPIEADSTSKLCSSSLKLPDSVKNYAAKKTSYSDTDVLTVTASSPQKDRKKCKKLRLDIEKANKSTIEGLNTSENDSSNIENTPKHILLNCKSTDVFCEKFKQLDFDLLDAMSDDVPSSPREDDVDDIVSISDNSESEISILSEDCPIKMCRKVEPDAEQEEDNENSESPDSFADLEVEYNDEKQQTLLTGFHVKIDQLESVLKKILTEFQYHIEITKVFQHQPTRPLRGADVNSESKASGELPSVYKLNEDSTHSWNIAIQNNNTLTKLKFRKQLLSMKNIIEHFINVYLQIDGLPKHELQRTLTYIVKEKEKDVSQLRLRFNSKKKSKRFDFPDIRDAMIKLFNLDEGNTIAADTSSSEDEYKCECHCHTGHRSSVSSTTDSGLNTKNDQSLSNHSITSSIGNFSLDTTTLTVYSESLDQVLNYNSFHDSSLYTILLQKAAIERITFYVQVHSIQLKCELNDDDFESKNIIKFHCPCCKITEMDENGLLKHILNQHHCEKIHFLYKTAYIKKCMSANKEIQPSTVLNPMRMYRDDNKIVCFGDAMYACSLCFESLIIGESVLMAHCLEMQHVERRDQLSTLLG